MVFCHVVDAWGNWRVGGGGGWMEFGVWLVGAPSWAKAAVFNGKEGGAEVSEREREAERLRRAGGLGRKAGDIVWE